MLYISRKFSFDVVKLGSHLIYQSTRLKNKSHCCRRLFVYLHRTDLYLLLTWRFTINININSGLLALPRQTFPEALAAEDAGYEDGERYQYRPHRVEEYRLLAEVHVLPAQVRDDLPADGVQPSPAEMFPHIIFCCSKFVISYNQSQVR